MQLFLEGSVKFRLLAAHIHRFASAPGNSAPKQGNRRDMIVRTKFMLGIICDQVLIQASESVRRSMNFFSGSRQLIFGRMLRNRSNFSTGYRP